MALMALNLDLASMLILHLAIADSTYVLKHIIANLRACAQKTIKHAYPLHKLASPQLLLVCSNDSNDGNASQY